MTTSHDQKMGVVMATIVGMNAMIGASIFLIPERLHRTVGPAALLTYLFVIVAVWTIAFSLARVAQYYKKEGSFYTYIKTWAGNKGGLIGAALYCIGLTVALGLLTRVTGNNLHILFPQISATALATGALLLLTLSLLIGARILKGGQIVLLVLTIAPLAIITFLGFLKSDIHNLVPFFPYGPNSVLQATKFVIFGFFGFEAVTALHTMVKDPEYTVPRAITASIIAVSLVYLTFVAATLLGIPRELALQGGSLPDFLYKLFPGYHWLITMVTVGIIITIMGTIHSMLWSVGSLIQSLTRLANLKIQLSTNQAIIMLSVLVWAFSVLLTNIDLFFNITALCLIIALAGAIWPLASNRIPSTGRERFIAWCGLASSVIMCSYALHGIWGYAIS
jgi:amino acid transporter